MSSIRTARAALRAATRGAHDRVDSLFSTTDLRDAASYRRFLLAQGAAQLSVEAALDASGADRVLADWPSRRRAALLRADLDDLSAAAPAMAALPPFDSDAAVIGAIYVLEGSRLGGQVLSRSVGPGLPTRFLGAADPAGWRRLLAAIETILSGPAEIATGIKAALQVFELFEHHANHNLEARQL